MATFCIPKPIAAKLKEAAQRKEFNIAKMFDMSSKERRGLFEKYAGADMAKEINAGFEKAMISNQKTALKSWAESTFTASAKKTERYNSVIKKINELDELGILTPETEKAFLTDLVASRLGATISAEEVRIISQKSQKLQKLADQPNDQFGLPSVEYFKARKDMDNYLDSLTPSSKLRVFTSVIGRGTMLFSLKSPLVNIESNTVKAVSDGFVRRMGALKEGNITMKGETGKLPAQYFKQVMKIYKETGYDVSRMFSLGEGRKTLGEERVHSQGKGIVRKVGRFYTDVVFDKLMTGPDVAFSAMHFSDSASLTATTIGKREGLKGTALRNRVAEIFKDATSINPKTEAGEFVRQKSIEQAMEGTYTNNTNLSKMSLSLRKALNDATGDFRAGDQLIAFAKVPANVLKSAADFSGLPTIIEIVPRFKKGIDLYRAGDSAAFKQAFDRSFFDTAVRGGIGITVSFALANQVKPDDFIGQYPTSQKEKELMLLKHATPNSIKIGGKWVSLDYLGPYGSPLIGMLYAKKFGKTAKDKATYYALGNILQLSNIPGLRQIRDLFEAGARDVKATVEGGKIEKSVVSFVVDFMRSRTIPAIVSDVGKAMDQYDRKIDYDKPLDSIIANIPVLREKLPIKRTTFGDPVQSQGFSQLLFGARIKKGEDNAIVQELQRLSNEGQLPAIGDVSKTSPRAKALKQQIGDQKFDKAMQYFGKRFKEEFTYLLDDDGYRSLTAEEKKNEIDKIKGDTFEEMLEEFDYQAPE